MAYFKRYIWTLGHFSDVFSGLYILQGGPFYHNIFLGHGQCFIWEFLLLTFIETARLNSSNFY